MDWVTEKRSRRGRGRGAYAGPRHHQCLAGAVPSCRSCRPLSPALSPSCPPGTRSPAPSWHAQVSWQPASSPGHAPFPPKKHSQSDKRKRDKGVAQDPQDSVEVLVRRETPRTHAQNVCDPKVCAGEREGCPLTLSSIWVGSSLAASSTREPSSTA